MRGRGEGLGGRREPGDGAWRGSQVSRFAPACSPALKGGEALRGAGLGRQQGAGLMGLRLLVRSSAVSFGAGRPASLGPLRLGGGGRACAGQEQLWPGPEAVCLRSRKYLGCSDAHRAKRVAVEPMARTVTLEEARVSVPVVKLPFVARP